MCPRCMMLEKATFEPFVRRDPNGVRFANRMRGRRWPVFRREARGFHYRRGGYVQGGPCHQKIVRSILKSSRVCAARRWLPCNPLEVHAMRVEDAWRRREPAVIGLCG